MLLVTPVMIVPLWQKPAPTTYLVRPLFFEQPQAQHTELARALETLGQMLTQQLTPEWKKVRHDALLPWTWKPPFSEHRVRGMIELKCGRFTLTSLLLVSELQGRPFGCFPLWPSFWFELSDPKDPAEEALGKLTRWLKQKEKEEDASALDILPQLSAMRFPHVQHLEIRLSGEPQLPSDKPTLQALAGAAPPMNGREELEATGRCLSRLPDAQLMTAPLREELVKELHRLLCLPHRRPVLLVGPPRVGKTALLHEVTRAFRAQEQSQKDHLRLIFQLAPDRLISGMSYVGQWEGRLTAILTYVKAKDHVLHFDDLLGLFRAGKSRDSSTSIGLILKGWLEQGALRVVGEITPEALGILRELDRGFVELFHLIPVREPTQQETWRMIIHATQTQPSLQGLSLNPQALKQLYALEARYHASQAFPGKALDLLSKISRLDVWDNSSLCTGHLVAAYHHEHGVDSIFLGEAPFPPRQLRSRLERLIKGQPAVIDALVRVVVRMSAGVSDPNRPIATLLFTGPSGAGKTWTVKVLKGLFFSSDESLVRFDMNEFTSAYSVTRLIGTFDHPEGLLTRALRRNPFCIILLDEIEKAHPDVFTLLLQVMGEGRLTDALGRTVDFTSSMVIMTSNLGVKEASRTFGFGTGGSGSAAWKSAVEAFFAPEFVNRLDEIVPFQPLDEQSLQAIVESQLSSALSRSGLVRKKVVISVAPEVGPHLLQQTRDLQLGARALRRTVEAVVVDAIGRQLADKADGTPHLLSLDREAGRLTFQLDALKMASTLPPRENTRLSWSMEQLRALEERLNTMEETLRAASGKNGAVLGSTPARPTPAGPVHGASVGSTLGPVLAPQELERLEVLEQLKTCQEHVKELLFQGEEGPAPDTSMARPLRKTRLVAGFQRREVVNLQLLLAAEEVKDYLREHARTAKPQTAESQDELVAALSTLESLTDASMSGAYRDVCLHVERVGLMPMNPSFEGVLFLLLTKAFKRLGLLIEPVGKAETIDFMGEYLSLNTSLRISGLQVSRVIEHLCGFHLLLDVSEGHDLLRVWVEDSQGQPIEHPPHVIGLYSCHNGVTTMIDVRTGARYDGPVYPHEVTDLLGDLLRDHESSPRWLTGLEALEPVAAPRRKGRASKKALDPDMQVYSALDSTRMAPKGRRS